MTTSHKQTIGLGILSWKAHKTLTKSLTSYPEQFLDYFDQRMIYFSDFTQEDALLAKRFNWPCKGGENQGIAGGMKALGESLDTDYILLLQNDNPLCEEPEFAIVQINDAIKLMQDNKIHLARMRHRWRIGEGSMDVIKYLKYYDVQNISPEYLPQEHGNPDLTRRPYHKLMRRLLKPHNKIRFQGRGIYIEENPERIFPEVIRKDGDFLIIDSSAIDFTDQCVLISKSLWRDVLMPYVDANPSSRTPNGFQAPEVCINGKWWRNQHYKIGQGRGIFTHARFDHSFRPEHPSYFQDQD